MSNKKDHLLDEARAWLLELKAAGIAGHSVLAQLIERLDPVELLDLSLRPSEGLQATLKGAPVRAFASSFIDWFRQEGGQNFVTLDISDPDSGESYSITMQKAGGKTPAQALAEHRAALDPVARKIVARDVHYQLIESYGLADNPVANAEIRQMLEKLATGGRSSS